MSQLQLAFLSRGEGAAQVAGGAPGLTVGTDQPNRGGAPRPVSQGGTISSCRGRPTGR